MTENRGRGIFATKSLKRGELIVVEKSVAECHQSTINFDSVDELSIYHYLHSELVKKCVDKI